VQYSPDWKKDVDRARDLLLDFGEDTLRRMARTLIEDPDEFSKSKTGVSIQRLYARRNHLAQSLRKPATADLSEHGKLELDQVQWRIRYIEDVLEKPSMQVDYCPKREDFLKLHDHYTMLLPRAEARSSAQKEKWGVATTNQDVATTNQDPSEILAEQMSDDR
jgi:hypothetical protein